MEGSTGVQKVSISRVVMGALFIAVGVLAMLGAIKVFDFDGFMASSWPLIFIVFGVLVYVSDAKNWIWALILTVAGLGWFLNVNHIVSFDVWSLFWPAVIVLIGISIITKSTRGDRPEGRDVDWTDQMVFMSGSEQRIVSDDYTGGKATAIMGGVELDLRDAVIKKTAVLDVFAVMGGVDVKVPAGVIVKTDVMAVLGGVENKADSKASKNAPVLIIRGTVALGGVEVKY